VELKTQSAADSELMESSVLIVDEVHNLYRNFNKDLQLTS
jgi:HrpA-like RNA helicase